MAEHIYLWEETDLTLGETHCATPDHIRDAEAEDNYLYIPVTPVWDQSLSPISENDHATTDAQMGLYTDMPGLPEPEDGQSEALTLPTAADLDYRFWGARCPFALAHSELVRDSHSMPVRQLNNEAGLGDEMRLFSDDTSPAASEASSVTLQGDDMSQLQVEEQDDDDYEATSGPHQILRRERQALMDIITNMSEILPEIERSYGALELGAHTIEYERTAKRQLCLKIDQLILEADDLNQRLKALNSAAAELDVDVETVNDRAMKLDHEIGNVDLDAWKSKLKTRKHKSRRDFPQDSITVPSDYTPVSPSSPQEPLRGYLELFTSPYAPDRHSMEDRSWNLYTARTSPLAYNRPGFPYDPFRPAAGMQDPSLQHAGWDGPSAYHNYDHSTSRYQPLISDPVESYLDPISAPQNSPQIPPPLKHRKSRRSRSRSPLPSCYQSQRPCYKSSK
jgi:hypothetical protein